MPTGGFKVWNRFFAYTAAKENHAIAAEQQSNASRKAVVQLSFVRTVRNKIQGYWPIA
jgi:hypothetical protein